MIVTVSTVKDQLHNVQRYVDGNLAGGADHLVLFLDQASPDVEAWLDTRPEVTYVVTDKSWWRGERPVLLNRRQRVNANLVKAVLAFSPWAQWVFHVDADEVVRIDRSVLDALPAHVGAVGLLPLEVVSVLHPDGEPTRFKRLLDDAELAELHRRGLLDEPTNSLYFRSHIAGKVGVRPRLDIWLGIHKAADRADQRLPLRLDPGLRMLHYESYSGDDFVRKWTSMVTSGPAMHFGKWRQPLAESLKAIVESDVPPETRVEQLQAVYQEHMEDDVATLAELGLLEEIDVRRPTHAPTPLADDERALFRQRLELLRDHDKWQFMPESDDAGTVDVRLGALFGAKPTRDPLVASVRTGLRQAKRALRGRRS